MSDAVRQRFGTGTVVDIDDVTSAVQVPPGRLNAVPDPDGRSGGRIGFSLLTARIVGGRVQAVRIGRASAIVRVQVEHVHTRGFVARGTAVSAQDAEVVRDEIARLPLRRLPELAEVIGARALRDLPAGACVTTTDVVLQPAVRAGDDVVVTASGPDFQATATMVAADSGAKGAVIRVVNRESRRTLRGRIVSKGVVSVIHE
jgi:flagella basal body P-ring formation protein FlgA